MSIQHIANRMQMWNMWEEVHRLNSNHNLSIHDFVHDSWKRSQSYGVDPYKRYNTEVFSPEQLDECIRMSQMLFDVAVPSMEDLYNITRDSGFCIVLADKDGVILKTIGSQRELRFTSVGNFVEGSVWSEETMGTNAIGTVLAIDQPIHIFGYEHYCKCACLSTCSAAPIHDENHNIIGVLDLTGPYKNVNPHTLGMVMAAAKAIEREMQLNKAYNEAKSADVKKQAVMESIIEGLIAIDKNGQITQMNRQAYDILEIPSDRIVHSIKDFIPKGNTYINEVLQSGRAIYGENISLNNFAGKSKKYIVNITPLKKQDNIEGYVMILHKMHDVIRIVNRPKNMVTFDTLIGQDKNYMAAIKQAKMASKSNSTILLTGESGVGKDLFAQAIHNNSSRKRETFFALNCGALPRELISSELFGYEEGAFTEIG